MQLIPILDVITKKQFENLKKLLAYLDTLPSDYEYFDMRVYSCEKRQHLLASNVTAGSSPTPGTCNTAGCLAGHGPIAGIKPKTRELWETYVFRVFGANCLEEYSTQSALFRWLFSGVWGSSPAGVTVGCQARRADEFKKAKLRLRYVVETKTFPMAVNYDDPSEYKMEALKLTKAYHSAAKSRKVKQNAEVKKHP